MSAYAMTIVHRGRIVFLDVGYFPGDVLTKAATFVNGHLIGAATTCNDVERFLEEHSDFIYLFKRTY